MSTPDRPRANPFLSGPLGPMFLRTAAPIIFMMLTNGIQALVDAWFIGVFVGAEALAAVTLMFPIFMLMVALSSLVSNGMASVLARSLGKGDVERAREFFSGAHGLALLVCAALIGLFAVAGRPVVEALADGSAPLATMGYDYIAILIWFSPVMFLLGVNGDALRCEGRLALMMLATIVVSAANIALTYVLVVLLDYGVIGAAVSTVMAQGIALAIVAGFRLFGATPLSWKALKFAEATRGWRDFVALGAPQSLSFIGISLVATAVIVSVQRWGGDGYAATVAAYGIITRIMTFAFMPLMGLNMATQTIVGNNFGAGNFLRSDNAFKLGLTVALAYTLAFEIMILLFAGLVGRFFVDDPGTIAEVGRIMPITIVFYFVSGGLLVISGYLQAVGDARTAILLTVTRTYLFTLPLILIIPFALGEIGIWMAAPVAELATALLATLLLWRVAQQHGYRWGLLRHQTKAA